MPVSGAPANGTRAWTGAQRGASGPEVFLEKRRAVVFSLAVLSLLVFLVYYRTIHGAFQLDDEVWILNNPAIRHLSNLPAMLRGQRGLTVASLALNYAAGGLDPAGYHLVNIFIHILNTLLVYVLVAMTLVLSGLPLPRARLLAICSAAVFSLHPVQTEAVTYIVQRMESMSALFYLLALIVFARGASAASPMKRGLYYVLAVCSYVAAFYSKEVALTLPAMVLLYDIWFISRGSLRGVIRRWPLYGALAFLAVFFTVNTVAPLGGFNDASSRRTLEVRPPTARAGEAERRYADIPALKRLPTAGFGVATTTPYEYFLTESNVLLYYYSLLVLPMNQNVDYDFPVSKGLLERPVAHEGARLTIPLPPPIVSLLVHASLIVLAIAMFVGSLCRGSWLKRCVSFFIIWFYLVLSPTSSFIPIVDVIFEHRLYLASLGYAVILTLVLERAIRGTKGRGPEVLNTKKH